MACALGVSLVMPAATAEPARVGPVLWVGKFDQDWASWHEIQLRTVQRPNRFQLIKWDAVDAVEVISESGMSLLARTISVDLKARPILCWRWRIDASVSKGDMTRREGDDYAARVYVSLRLPPESLNFSVRTQLALARAIWGSDVPDAAINYVWDNRFPAGTVRPNAYTDRTRMVVLRSGDAEAGRWVWERVNVFQDMSRLFGESAEISQLALTSDTDNTGSSARAGFADFHFVSADQQCEIRGAS